MLAGYFVSFILAAVLVVFCARWPHTLGRLLQGWIFLLAGAVNVDPGRDSLRRRMIHARWATPPRWSERQCGVTCGGGFDSRHLQ